MQQTQPSIGQERTRASTRSIRLFRVSVSQCLFTLATRLLVAYLPCMRYFSDDFWFICFSLPQRSSRKGEKKSVKDNFCVVAFVTSAAAAHGLSWSLVHLALLPASCKGAFQKPAQQGSLHHLCSALMQRNFQRTLKTSCLSSQ